jgi:hypothetical protein
MLPSFEIVTTVSEAIEYEFLVKGMDYRELIPCEE